jgi:basic membrane protein A
VSKGADKFKAETKIDVVDFEPSNETQFEQAQRRFAQRTDPIIAVGFSQAVALEKVAGISQDPLHHHRQRGRPAQRAVGPVQGTEGCSCWRGGGARPKSGKVGFVGGMDIPLIRRFQCGYEQGVKYANPKAELVANMTGTTPAAWNDRAAAPSR